MQMYRSHFAETMQSLPVNFLGIVTRGGRLIKVQLYRRRCVNKIATASIDSLLCKYFATTTNAAVSRYRHNIPVVIERAYAKITRWLAANNIINVMPGARFPGYLACVNLTDSRRSLPRARARASMRCTCGDVRVSPRICHAPTRSHRRL